MSVPASRLDFALLDDLAFAAQSSRLSSYRPPRPLAPAGLGPIVELWLLVSGGLFSPDILEWIPGNAAALLSALRSRRDEWISANGRIGVCRAVRSDPNADERSTGFQMAVKRAAAQTAGFSGQVPGLLLAGLVELESNVHEHSDAADTGIIAFRAAPGVFEFVVADAGIGVLRSLGKSKAFSGLRDHGEALHQALTEGVSRHGVNAGRGFGFRQVFVGLADLHGSLRFRSGDHAMTLDGISPNEKGSRISQKVPLQGFFAHVRAMLPQKAR